MTNTFPTLKLYLDDVRRVFIYIYFLMQAILLPPHALSVRAAHMSGVGVMWCYCTPGIFPH
jgi:hypothetical protein